MSLEPLSWQRTFTKGLVIFDSSKYARDPNAVSGHLASVIQQFGGKILASRLWEERRLAYPINGQRKGTYWITHFQLDALQLLAVNAQLRLDENILRSMTLKIDPRIAETMVSHALSGGNPVAERHPAAAAPSLAMQLVLLKSKAE